MKGQSGKPLGIIAGGGTVPAIVAAAAANAGRPVFIIGIDGEVDTAIGHYPHALLRWGQIGRMQRLLAEHGVGDLVLIGSIRARPDFRSLKLDLGAVRLMPQILAILGEGDSSLLSGVVRLFGQLGYNVLGAHEIAPELVAGCGPLGKARPDRAADRDVAKAMEAARSIGVIDAGQAAVAINGRIVALEAAEGTDAMLERVAALKSAGRIRWTGRAGVIAKCAKPQQDLRVDMPTIGPGTVKAAAEIGLAGIAVEAGRVMIVDRDEVVALANRNGLFVAGAAGPESTS